MTPTKDTRPSIYATMMASATAGMTARVFCHPLDTMKARLQADVQMKSYYRNTVQALRRTIRLEGMMGLYRGFGITLLGSAPGTCLYLTSYEQSKQRLSPLFQSTPALVHLSAGMIAETISCVFWVPVDVIKERLQIQSSQRLNYYTGTVDAIKTIWKTEGLRGIYKGYAATVISFGPFSALYFLFYEQSKSLSKQITQVESIDQVPFSMLLLGSAVSGALASLVTNPLDLVKLRLQIQRSTRASSISESSYTSVVNGLSQIIRKEGIGGLWTGSGARMAFHAPATAITLATYERYVSILTADNE